MSAESQPARAPQLAQNWAVVVPMANEAPDFAPFVAALGAVLDETDGGTAYFVVDRASKDNTRELCEGLSARDRRFITVWAPENKNVVDAYLRGFRAACDAGHEFIVEMDAGLSHDPAAIPRFLRALADGNDCVFGSRFCPGGSMSENPWFRRTLSRAGTVLSNTLLGSRLYDMTSGFEAFRRDVIGALLAYPLRSRAHFYQTEVRYLLRRRRSVELPIHYQAPSASVSRRAIRNAVETLLYYFGQRLRGRAPAL